MIFVAANDELKQKVLEEAKKSNVRFVKLQFVDIFGNAKCCEIPVERLDKALYEGIGFDGSSIEGFVRIYESDMIVRPDPATFAILPWGDGRVARLFCDIYTPEGKPFEGDPRHVLRSVMKDAETLGYTYNVGPELEFFLFRECNGSPAAAVHDAGGYFDLDPIDLAADVRRNVVIGLQSMGIEIEMGHHEVAPGQHEIDFKYGDALIVADRVLTYKNTVKTIARQSGLFASFMPKPVFGENGSGMHVHQSLWSKNGNAFFDASDDYKLSEAAYHFIGGQLKYAREFCAVVAPTVNSYKRLVPGYEAPVYVCWGNKNRSALIRVPEYFPGRENATRAELRCPDPSSNPYLAFAAMLAAGLEGMRKKIEPPDPVEENVYHFDDAKLAKLYVKTLPGSLGEAISELRQSELMKKALGSHVFEKLLEAQKREWDEYRIQVTKWELDKYFPVL